MRRAAHRHLALGGLPLCAAIFPARPGTSIGSIRTDCTGGGRVAALWGKLEAMSVAGEPAWLTSVMRQGNQENLEGEGRNR